MTIAPSKNGKEGSLQPRRGVVHLALPRVHPLDDIAGKHVENRACRERSVDGRECEQLEGLALAKAQQPGDVIEVGIR